MDFSTKARWGHLAFFCEKNIKKPSWVGLEKVFFLITNNLVVLLPMTIEVHRQYCRKQSRC